MRQGRAGHCANRPPTANIGGNLPTRLREDTTLADELSATPCLILASQSPRRAELLTQLGLQFRTVVAPVDERPHAGEGAVAYVQRLARHKAAAGVQAAGAEGSGQPEASVILAADTIVVIDERIFGKPAHEEDALAQLMALSGRTHQVFTAVALVHGAMRAQCVSKTDVQFRTISETEARAYWRTGEPADKAGGYAIQGLGAVFATHITGSYSGVMGLPLAPTATLLERAGISVWKTAD